MSTIYLRTSTVNDLCYDLCLAISSYLTVNEIFYVFNCHSLLNDILRQCRRKSRLHLSIVDDMPFFLSILPHVSCQSIDSLCTAWIHVNQCLDYFTTLVQLELIDVVHNMCRLHVDHLVELEQLSIGMRSAEDNMIDLQWFFIGSSLPTALRRFNIDCAYNRMIADIDHPNDRSRQIRSLSLKRCYWPMLVQILGYFPCLRVLRIDLARPDPESFYDSGKRYLTTTTVWINLQQLTLIWTDIDIDAIANLLSHMPNLRHGHLHGTYQRLFQQKFIALNTWLMLTQHCLGQILNRLDIQLFIDAGLNPAVSLFRSDVITYLQRIHFQWETSFIGDKTRQRRIVGCWKR
jgi:hypothetical protein